MRSQSPLGKVNNSIPLQLVRHWRKGPVPSASSLLQQPINTNILIFTNLYIFIFRKAAGLKKDMARLREEREELQDELNEKQNRYDEGLQRQRRPRNHKKLLEEIEELQDAITEKVKLHTFWINLEIRL